MTDYPALTTARGEWRYQPASDCLAGKVLLVTGAGDGIGRRRNQQPSGHSGHHFDCG